MKFSNKNKESVKKSVISFVRLFVVFKAENDIVDAYFNSAVNYTY